MEKGNKDVAPVKSTGGTGTATTSPPGGQGGQQADQSRPISWKDISDLMPGPPTREELREAYRQWRTTATDEELEETAAASEAEADLYQEEIFKEIEAENPDHEWIDDARHWQDELRDGARLNRQELHEREMARPSGSKPADAPAPQRPSAEVQHPGGTRTGVDETGKGYETDSAGQRIERERFDRFGPGGGG
jgi:hypothetical protein